MKKLLIIFIITATAGSRCSAQFSRYIVRLKDKSNNNFSVSAPLQFLTQRSIDRRKRYNIAVDESDLPVTPAYLDSIRLSGNVIILNVSKWLNQVCIQSTDAAALNKISSFTFVVSASPIAARLASQPLRIIKQLDAPGSAININTAERPMGTDLFDYGQSYNQVHLNNTEFLHNHGFRGEGMQLSIMDGGFYHYQSLPTFDSVRTHGQVLSTWDFVAGDTSVNEDNAHGMECFSAIAANMPGVFIGAAPKTSFYLFRTEDVNSEYPVEEQNWAAAAERADSLGADVFSVSLGYNTFDDSSFNHTYADMDGNTTIIAKAADFAAKKGIIVVVAAGNEGNMPWHYITTPADADSVLAIGAVDINRHIAAFSGYGPSSDGQIKPDVAAVGVNAVVANPNTGSPSFGSGTSFACPIMAGVATCLWQAFPEVNNMGIIDALRKSSDRAVTPDDRTGYGVPDSKRAFVYLIKKLYTQQISIDNNCKANIAFMVKTAADMNIIIERKLPSEAGYASISTQHSGNNFASTGFTYSDDLNGLPANIVINYRIKMTIASDTSFYLDSAVVNYTQPCTSPAETIRISPNPVTDKLSILITRNNPVNAAIEIYAANGQKVYSVAGEMISGTKTFIVPMKQFSRGIYFVTVFISNKKTLTKKVIR